MVAQVIKGLGIGFEPGTVGQGIVERECIGKRVASGLWGRTELWRCSEPEEVLLIGYGYAEVAAQGA